VLPFLLLVSPHLFFLLFPVDYRTNWAIPVKVVVKRRKADGWEEDLYTEFALSGMTASRDSKGPPFNHVFVGGNTNIPKEFIPQELQENRRKKKTEDVVEKQEGQE
jgi:hypothetical protein